ncbi:hypothetical protein HRG_008924 [Hirsutella rhossiliensis]
MRNLSSDLWHYIADYLLPHYALLNIRGVLPGPRAVSINSITTAKKMWYGFTDYEGTSYVSWLSSSPRGPRSLSLASNADRAPGCLLLTAENHLGITDVRLSDFRESNAISERPGTWWRTIPLDCLGMKVDVESDGIKLRRLVCGDLGTIAWSVPEPRTPRFHYFTDGSSSRAPARMTFFRSNHPEATGYSFLWDCGLVHIHAHVAGEDTAFYRSLPPGSWLYMPVDHGEFISEIWQQKSLFFRERAIAFVTNNGRVFVAGIYLRADRMPFVLIERPSQELGRIYFESSANGIGALAFATDAPRIEHLLFKCPQPSPNNILLSIENYFFSSHSLDRLEEVTPCLAKDGTGVVGLILHFPDGHRGSLGQVRFDSLGDRFTIAEKPSWFLGFGKQQGRYPYVVKVAACRPRVDGDVQDVMELSRTGKLEWIWSERQCLVLYNGCRSPPTT